MCLDWTAERWVYTVIFHVDIINGKIWVQQDNTEVAIANLMLEEDIKKSKIILGYFSERRSKSLLVFRKENPQQALSISALQ